MDMQMAPPTYAAAGNPAPPTYAAAGNPAPPTYAAAGNPAPPTGNPPMLGQQIPGMTGGLPAQGGLPVTANPMAEQLRSQGRDEDTMLVHMTPGEVNSLQGLAMAHGGSLTINPETGLPEAGFLKKLLPTLLGIGLNFIPGIGPLAAAGLVAAGSVAKTGSLKKGLMAGLQAYGGASLAGGLAPAATGTKLASTVGGAGAGGFGSSANMARGLAADSMIANTATTAGTTTAKTGLAGLAQNFGNAAKAGLPAGTPGIISKAAPKIAAMGLMQGVSGAMTPSGGSAVGPSGQIDNSYQGPYYAQDRQQIMDLGDPTSSKQRRHFAIGMPEIYNTMGQVVQPGSHTARGTQIIQPRYNPKAKKGQNMYDFVPVTYMGGVDPNKEEGYASGGEVQMSDGAFVLDARTVSELGNGSSNAGMELLSRMGGRPLQGPGDGVSDSIPARIGRDQPARVARDEVLMPAEAVRRIGKGNPQRGADKLYSLMNKAHKARKKAGRGQDTKLRHGLG
jgi:hypothetical protein